MGRGRAALLLSLFLATSMGPRTAFGQTEAELAQARRLFGEAVKDEERNDYEAALGKFRKVQGVRDTAGVRYRIATCLEGLGKLVEAGAAYRAAEELARADTSQTDVAKASHERLVELDRRVPSLTLTMSPKAPADATVHVDGRPVPAGSLGQPMQVEVGNHRITGRASGVPPFDTEVTLQEGGRVSMNIPLDPPAPVGPTTPPNGEGGSTTTTTRVSPTVGWILVGGGAALVVGSGVMLLLRESAISTMKKDCPGNRCPESTRAEVTSARDRAKALLPVSLVVGAVGVLAAGTGTFLLLRSRGESGSTNTPNAPPPTTTSHLDVRAFFTPYAGGLSMDGAF